MSAEHSSEEGGEGLTTCPASIPVEHTIGSLPDDCDVCAPANARLQAVLADRLAAVQAELDEWYTKALRNAREAAETEAERDDLRGRLAAVEALADDLLARQRESWDRYMSAMGVTSQALWQGKFEGIEEAANRLRAALANSSAAQGEGEVR